MHTYLYILYYTHATYAFCASLYVPYHTQFSPTSSTHPTTSCNLHLHPHRPHPQHRASALSIMQHRAMPLSLMTPIGKSSESNRTLPIGHVLSFLARFQKRSSMLPDNNTHLSMNNDS
jgi:hypothetical protein